MARQPTSLLKLAECKHSNHINAIEFLAYTWHQAWCLQELYLPLVKASRHLSLASAGRKEEKLVVLFLTESMLKTNCTALPVVAQILFIPVAKHRSKLKLVRSKLASFYTP